MNESLETKLHNYLKAQGGKVIPYEQIKNLVEHYWITPKGGHYRMETLTRRWRKDNSRPSDISDRIGKEFKDNAIVSLYYKTDSLMEQGEVMKEAIKEVFIKPLIQATSMTAAEFLAKYPSKKEEKITNVLF